MFDFNLNEVERFRFYLIIFPGNNYAASLLSQNANNKTNNSCDKINIVLWTCEHMLRTHFSIRARTF